MHRSVLKQTGKSYRADHCVTNTHGVRSREVLSITENVPACCFLLPESSRHAFCFLHRLLRRYSGRSSTDRTCSCVLCSTSTCASTVVRVIVSSSIASVPVRSGRFLSTIPVASRPERDGSFRPTSAACARRRPHGISALASDTKTGRIGRESVRRRESLA
jgi:hypothetical protein